MAQLELKLSLLLSGLYMTLAQIQVPASSYADILAEQWSSSPPSSARYKGPQSGPHGGQVGGEWKFVGSGQVLAVEMAILPGSNDKYIGRNKNGVLPYKDYLVGIYDYPTQSFSNVTTDTNVFCGMMAPTYDGKLIDVGGSGPAIGSGFWDGRNLVRLYDSNNDSSHLPNTTYMTWNRWYPTVTMLPNHKHLIHGGTLQGVEEGTAAPDMEFWDPANPTQFPLVKAPIDPVYLTNTGQNFFPFNFLLPTGDIWNQCDDQIRVIHPDGTYVMDGAKPWTTAGIIVRTQYPMMGSAVMTALTPSNKYSSVDIVVFGGVPRNNTCTWGYPEAFELDSKIIWRTTVTWTKQADGTYTYQTSGWDQDDMLIARAGVDATLLPNGDVVVLNGGQTGCPGGTNKGERRNNFPAFWPVLYQPDRPLGQRATIMSAIGVARMYHGTSNLMMDGSLLVAGCDSCGGGVLMQKGIEVDFYDICPTGTYEYRIQKFETPYVLDVDFKPSIMSIDGTAVTDESAPVPLKRGQTINIVWKSESSATLVNCSTINLVASSSATHGFNTNQRVVELIVKNQTQNGNTGTITVEIPDLENVLPDQFYHMFPLNGKTYGRSRWVSIVGSVQVAASAAPLAPTPAVVLQPPPMPPSQATVVTLDPTVLAPPPPPPSLLTNSPTPNANTTTSQTTTSSNSSTVGVAIGAAAAGVVCLIAIAALIWFRKHRIGHTNKMHWIGKSKDAGLLDKQEDNSTLPTATIVVSTNTSTTTGQTAKAIHESMFPQPIFTEPSSRVSGVPGVSSELGSAARGVMLDEQTDIGVTAVVQKRVLGTLRIAWSDIELGQQLGQGGFGTVYLGSWQGNRVAVKMLNREHLSQEARAALHHEVLMMCELRHPCIAPAYGLVDEDEHHALIMRYYKRGTLANAMRTTAYEQLDLVPRLKIALQVATGIRRLHEAQPRPIIHGDLKTSNILLDDDGSWRVVIADFGLACSVCTSGQEGGRTAVGMTISISPPEVLEDPFAPRTLAVDSYAFAIVLLEIVQGAPLYRGMRAQEVVNAVKQGRRAAVSASVPDDIAALVQACWAQDPAARPGFKECTEKLKQSIDEHSCASTRGHDYLNTTAVIRPDSALAWR